MLTRRNALALGAGLMMTPFVASTRQALASVVYIEDAIAIDGSDAVAYFDNAGPVVGDPSITHAWNGATWQFATTANRDAFAADPERWAPQYGGYCAYALANGYVAPTMPDAWTLHDGKLYLNFNLNVRNLWNQDRAANIARGDSNWPSVRATLV